MPTKDDMKRWNEDRETISRANVMLFGFDISKLNVREQEAVIEATKRRWELEAELERRNPRPLIKEEQLEVMRFELQLAKLQKELDDQDKRLERQTKWGW
ncbi:hypothetical protein FZC76_07800 [Sutcliffiella horikoshii]|uniref:Uncharacterized protein n=1 Tax=Sutcliffiella horikoshii TaxID=79883 RepID=A0A5D4SZV1_9BACI|nr:hypothetical protein [Sutcliffiella horikoshii]TYS68833.1 hypothetical protein FZC76_07800 [Sutcliffiella horikoshii]